MISARRVLTAGAALGAAATVLLTAPAASAAPGEAADCLANGLSYAEGTVINLPGVGTVPVACKNGQWVQ